MKFTDFIRRERRAKLCSGFETEVFITRTGGGNDLAFGFLSGADAGGGYVEEPDFFEPARENVLDGAGDMDEVCEDAGEFFFVNGHVGFNAETLTGRLEPEDGLPHDGTEGAPLLEFEFGIDSFLVVAEFLSCHFVGLKKGEFDEGSEGGDDDGLDVGGGAGLGEESDGTIPLKLARNWLVVVIAKWCVIEPRLTEPLS